MTIDEAIAVFSSYSLDEKREFIAGLIHDLTVIARESYDVEGEGLTNPQRLRRVNEIQHRVSAYLWALMRNDPQRYPDSVLVKIILEHPDDDALERQLRTVFARLTTRRLTIA